MPTNVVSFSFLVKTHVLIWGLEVCPFLTFFPKGKCILQNLPFSDKEDISHIAQKGDFFLWSTDLAIGVNDRRDPCNALNDGFFVNFLVRFAV